MATFSDYIQGYLDKLGWNRSEFARKSGLDSGYVSNVLNEVRNPGPDFCRGAAKAFGVSQVEVFFAAGLITELPNKDYDLDREQWAAMYDKMTESDREDIINFIEVKTKKKGSDKK